MLARDAARSLWFCLLAGILAGASVFALEAIDRISVLWPSFASMGEVARYAALLSPDVLFGVATGLALGVILAAAGMFTAVAARPFRRLGARRSWIAGSVLASVALTLAIRVASLVARGSIEDPLYRVAKKVSDRVVGIPFVLDHFGLLLTLGALAVVALVIAAAALPHVRLPRGGRIAAGVAATAVALSVVALYAFDSRIFYGRYEITMHMPAEVVLLLTAILASALMLLASERDVVRRSHVVTVILLAVVATSATAFALVRFDENQNVKALLWRRGVVSRRFYQAVAWVTDHDADGFSARLGGGDGNDSDPGVNPLVTEVAGNGVDDNCIGGDLAAPVTPASDPPDRSTPGAAKNFILISIDTLRADRMSCYGYYRRTAERLEELGASGVVFDRAYSQGTNTGISFASMQRSATRHAIFDDDRPTLFGRLSDAGFKTTLINARRDDAWLETKRWSDYRRIILDGVQTYDHVGGDSLWDGDRVTDRAIEYLSSLPAGTKHATWVHYLDPHEPRRKMAPFDFGNSASDKYDTEVAFADREVGRLIDWLRSSGRMRDSLVVLVADHGESFLDHGMDLHGNRPYDEQIHVPLMMWAPDVEPTRVHTPVGVWDVAPTVLSYLGLEPIPDAEGRDILRSEIPDRPIYSETPRNLVEVSFFAYAVTVDDWRYIYDVRGNTVELYDLGTDPLELVNLVHRRPERARELRHVLARWLDTTVTVHPRRGA